MYRRMPLALAALFAVACVEVATDPRLMDPWDLGTLGPSLSVIPSLPPVCGDATTTRLIADEVVPVGTVEVTQGPVNLYVVYRTDPGWPILNTALFVEASISEIPTNSGGNPRVGQFPYKARHDGGPNEVIWEIPLASLNSTDVVLAAFAEVGETVEGAWGEGEPIYEGGNWSMYFEHSVTSCGAATVDAAGGTVSTPGGEASILIPAGALTASVDITIEPSSVEGLLEHASTTGEPSPAAAADAPGTGGAAPAPLLAELELPTVFGTVPIEGTVWDFGPDGLEFDEPAIVTLSYEDAWIPEGVDEADLRIFVINGIFVQPPSTVDPVLNTVSAPIDHFSFAYIGFLESAEADLSVISATESGDPILVGESVTYQATIENFG
ncbi:MAG TPA: hypothetical protein VLA09_02465, partial [Longimicrobiales bacterium]|nr:hypothetical protein [Longimicrobiales bacterium]